MEVEFLDTLPPPLRKRLKDRPWREFHLRLKENPGKWGRFEETLKSASNASTLAYSLRRGLIKSLVLPEGKFEYTTRRNGMEREWFLYGRYLLAED